MLVGFRFFAFYPLIQCTFIFTVFCLYMMISAVQVLKPSGYIIVGSTRIE